MILKMNRKSKGKKGVVEYLLNEREKEGTAITLRGNPQITQALIKSIERKHKYLSGGLMFSKEEYIYDEQKKEIMDAFEEVLFAGIDTDKYNILWVEHSDKERIELNFVIPRLALDSGNDLDLYSHRRDLPLMDMWKNGINAKYGLADPNDPRRARTMTEGTKVCRGNGLIVANRKNLDETLHQLAKDGQIKSRVQMIGILQKSGYQITRKNEESISVKHPDIGKKALRLKGGIYCETFTSIGGIESISEERERRITKYDNKVARGETSPNRSTYKKYLQKRVERHQKRYARVRQVDSQKPSNIKKRDTDDVVAKNDDKSTGRVDYDRIREFTHASRKRRETSIKRAREREENLLRNIKKFNLRVQEQLGRTEQGVYADLAESRAYMETDIAKNGEGIDTKIESSDRKDRSFEESIRELFEGINERVAELKKSIKGAIDEIKKMKLFKKASEQVSLERPKIRRTPWS